MNAQTTSGTSGKAKPKVGRVPPMMTAAQVRYGLQEMPATPVHQEPQAQANYVPAEQAYVAPVMSAQPVYKAAPATFFGWDLRFVSLLFLLFVGINAGLITLLHAHNHSVQMAQAQAVEANPTPMQPAASGISAAPQNAAARVSGTSSNTPQELLSVIGRD